MLKKKRKKDDEKICVLGVLHFILLWDLFRFIASQSFFFFNISKKKKICQAQLNVRGITFAF